ncbi:hypothetical protein K490DRAFT_60778 [Saccharata proteae CBS 121410]|uniref:Uncharacterized protein n=1 Tax=Saccharata proteae CBS 121410 TaxID=1314787 RepID=A0A9P4I2J8_9PEZI|nr:hypothetical protein K490DRAFT_60778 [Saccharata proteae CBS 121410]
MSSKSVGKPSANAVQQRETEAKESKAGGEAKAGLNLNILGALSGSMGSRSKKTHETDGDGWEKTEEESNTGARAQGQGAANLNAAAAAKANKSDRSVKQTDHLGIEG